MFYGGKPKIWAKVTTGFATWKSKRTNGELVHSETFDAEMTGKLFGDRRTDVGGRRA
jgi:hypothetical protein